MCGIVGILNKHFNDKASGNLLEEMLLLINHRGPDERGIYLNNNLGLGNVRLSIIDITGGQQPLSDASGNFWIVFNGEVFNFIELKSELETRGYHFKTKSDTEVVVAGYSLWGTSFISKLNGQFAFAIWDKKKQELLLVRDRVGICPLFYSNCKNSFIFGSEIKAILQHPGIKPELDINSLCQIFSYWSTLTPATLFKNISEVTPGNYVLINTKGVQVQPYWRLQFPDKQNISKITLPEAKEELEEILTDAVKIRLRADVMVAAYLSGGLDSTTTTALIKKIEPGILNTFSIGFSDQDFDETYFQQEASIFLNTKHKRIECTNEDISESFPNVIWHSESPMLRTAPAPMYNLSKFVKQNNIKVVITGEGADEMLAGYDLFKEMVIRRFWARDPRSKFRPLLLKKLYPFIPQISNANTQSLKFYYGYRLEDTDFPAYSHLMRWNNGRHIMKYIHSSHKEIVNFFNPFESWMNLRPEGFDDYGDLSKAQYLESTLFMSGYLLSSQGDRMTMANSVEGRYPFLDHRFIEFAARLPEGLKLHGLDEKYILKKMIKDKIPESIRKRPKQAYRAPISSSFFKKSQGNYVDSLLDIKTIDDYGIFDSTLSSKLVKKIKTTGTASEVENMIVTAIISAQLFYQFFILGKRPVSLVKPKSYLRLIEENK
jgi:asparagine synthase (glutamine-hydrolysing)